MVGRIRVDLMSKGQISLEAVFGFTVIVFLVGFMILTKGSYRLDTTPYEYYVMNDILEVSEKLGYTYNYTTPNDLQQIVNLAKPLGFCMMAEDMGSRITTDGCDSPRDDVITTTRVYIDNLGQPHTVRFWLWKGE